MDKLQFLKTCFLVLVVIISNVKSDDTDNKPIANATFLDTLTKDLTIGYDRKQREREIKSGIEVDLRVRHIEVLEITSTIQIYGRIKWNWVDDKLQWNASSYGDITELRISEWTVWTPQLDLLNEMHPSSSSISHNGFSSAHVVVQSNGSATYEVDFQFAAFCGLDLHAWPFDQHVCQFDFEAPWSPHVHLNPHLMRNDDEREDKMSFISAAWELKALLFGIDPATSDYYAVTLKLHIARRTSAYAMTLFAPVTVIVVLTLCGFWLPVQAGEKILLNGIIGVLVSLYTMYFAEKLPSMGINTPPIVKFNTFTLYLTMCSMILAILVLAISRTKHVYGTPWVIKRWLEGPCGQFLMLSCLSSTRGAGGEGAGEVATLDVRAEGEIQADDEADENGDEEISNNQENQQVWEVTMEMPTSAQNMGKLRTNSIQRDWIMLATAIDRIAFLIYSAIFAVIAIVYDV